MPLPINITSLSSLLMQLNHRRVAQGVMSLLLVYIAFVSANITWSVVPQAQDQSVLGNSNQSIATKKNKNKVVDVKKIQSLNLFGLYNETEEEEHDIEMSSVPETSLNLTLSGLVASDDNKIAAAVIENQGKQETYGIGDVIVGTRANLEQVLMDRVLIKHSGKLETLMLDGFDYNKPVERMSSKAPRPKQAKAPSTGVVDQRTNKSLTETAKNLRSELAKDPAKIGDYLRISPKRKDGNIVGYSLRPGKKPEFFKLAGLQNGDVVVQMNGYDLIAPAQAMQAMVEMKQARDISLLVERQGNLTEILISLD